MDRCPWCMVPWGTDGCEHTQPLNTSVVREQLKASEPDPDATLELWGVEPDPIPRVVSIPELGGQNVILYTD